MPLSNFIRNIGKSQQFKTLIVRAIEDAIVILVMVIGIWLTCAVVGGIFRLLGVA